MNIDKIGLENLPNCYFRRIKITEMLNEINILGEVVVFDDEDEYWSQSSLITNYLLIKITFYSSEPTEEGEFDSLIIKNFDPNTSISFNEKIPNPDPAGNYYVSCRLELDLERLKQVYNEHDFNFGDEIQQWYRGPMFVEHIWKDGEPNNVHYTFKKDGEDYLGTLHRYRSSANDTSFRIMQGSRHRQNTHTFLDSNKVDSVSPKFSYLEQQSFNPDDSTGTYITGTQPSSATTDLFHAKHLGGITYESSYFLFYHLEGLCLDSNDAALQYYKTNKTLFRNFKDIVTVNSISIEKQFTPSLVSETLIVFDPKDESTFINEETSTQIIKGPEFSSDNELKTFQIKHNFRKTNEEFHYKIKINYTNNLTKHIKESLQKLTNAFNLMSGYINNIFWQQGGQELTPQTFVNINNVRGFNVSYNQQTGVYDYNSNNEDIIAQEGAFWIEIPVIYKQIENLISYYSVDDKNAMSLFNLINPVTATIETLQQAGTAIRDLINLCIIKYDINISSNNNALSVNTTDNLKQKFIHTLNSGHFEQIKNTYTNVDVITSASSYSGLSTSLDSAVASGETFRPETSKIGPPPNATVVGAVQISGNAPFNTQFNASEGLGVRDGLAANIGKFLEPDVTQKMVDSILDLGLKKEVLESISSSNFDFNNSLASAISNSPYSPSIGVLPNLQITNPLDAFGLQTQGSVISNDITQALVESLRSTGPSDVREFLGSLTLFQFVEGETPVDVVIQNSSPFEERQDEQEAATQFIGEALLDEVFNILPKSEETENTFTKLRESILSPSNDNDSSFFGIPDGAVYKVASAIVQEAMRQPVVTYVRQIGHEPGFQVFYENSEDTEETRQLMSSNNNQRYGLWIYKLESFDGIITYGIMENL